MTLRDDGAAGRGPLRRRDFLALGSLAALTPVVAPLFAPRAAAGATLDAAAPAAAAAAGTQADAAIQRLPLSVGYLEGSELLENLRKLPPDLTVLTVRRRGGTFTTGRHLLPSHSMPAGDPALVGGAVRMTVHDLYPRLLPDGPAAEQWPQAIDLDVMVPLLEPPAGSTARFAAWSYRRLPGRLPSEDRSARVSFVLWPDWYSDLSLVLRVVPPAGSPTRLLQASFTLGADKGRPRLLKGIYLLGLDRGTWDEAADLPDDPAEVPPERLSVLVTIEPEGLRLGSSRR
ncbi:MAG TPA: hypothetical protein VKY89_23170 [Thermoanaerobaculia bacterium]|nr:hypothetical protein [Thermoanaerobaculia bacterium]